MQYVQGFVLVFLGSGPTLLELRQLWLGMVVLLEGWVLGVSKLVNSVGTVLVFAGYPVFINDEGRERTPASSFVPRACVYECSLWDVFQDEWITSLPCDPGAFQIADSMLYVPRWFACLLTTVSSGLYPRQVCWPFNLQGQSFAGCQNSWNSPPLTSQMSYYGDLSHVVPCVCVSMSLPLSTTVSPS